MSPETNTPATITTTEKGEKKRWKGFWPFFLLWLQSAIRCVYVMHAVNKSTILWTLQGRILKRWLLYHFGHSDIATTWHFLTVTHTQSPTASVIWIFHKSDWCICTGVCFGKVKNLDIRNQFFSLKQTFLTSGFLDKRNLENQQTNQYCKGFLLLYV